MTQSTMRGLLARWAAVEPERCRPKEQIRGFTVHSGEVWDFMLLENLATEESQMRIQWAVQEAIAAQGWSYSLEYSRSTKKNSAIVVIPGIVKRGEGYNTDNSAEALLTAYLQALENKKAG